MFFIATIYAFYINYNGGFCCVLYFFCYFNIVSAVLIRINCMYVNASYAHSVQSAASRGAERMERLSLRR